MKTTTELIRWFNARCPGFVKAMKQTDHGLDSNNLNPFHLEGGIFTHSMMVLKEVDRLDFLIPRDKYLLSIVALCHDIGKPLTRFVKDNGKVTFYNHEAVSAFHSIDLYEELGLSQSEKEYIFQTIALHTDYFKIPRQELANKLIDQQLHTIIETFGKCDHAGRFHDKGEEIRYTGFIPTPESYNIAPDKGKTVTVMVGLPASGKSTYIEQNAPEGSFIISRDAIVEALGDGITYTEKWNSADQKEVDEVLQDLFKQAKNENNVFVDMTHMSTKSRRRSLAHFGKDWTKNCVVILPGLEQLTENSITRKKTTGKYVDDSVVLGMMKNFSCPNYGEGFHNIEWRF